MTTAVVNDTLIRVGAVEHNGWYPATVVGTEIVSLEYGPIVRFAFLTDDGYLAWGRVNLRASQGCKLFRWAEILLGRQLQDGDKIDLRELTGKRCMVLVTITEQNGKRLNTVKTISTIGGETE